MEEERQLSDEAIEPKKYTIVEMPDRELLEDFLAGFFGPVKVVFNTDKGIFERVMSPEGEDDDKD